jgi:hypothetical protein
MRLLAPCYKTFDCWYKSGRKTYCFYIKAEDWAEAKELVAGIRESAEVCGEVYSVIPFDAVGAPGGFFFARCWQWLKDHLTGSGRRSSE